MTNEAQITADIHARLTALTAKPKTHASVITYSDGSEQRVPHPSELQASNYLRSYRPLIGRHQYVSRATGQKITIVSCEVEAL